MADYSRYMACGCSYYSTHHNLNCKEHPDYEKRKLAENSGMRPVWKNSGDIMSEMRIVYFECQRGCGCLVWNISSHIKNVCVSDGK